MRHQRLLRLGSLVSAAALSLPMGTAGQALLAGFPVVDAVTCDTTLSISPGGSNPNELPDGLKNVAYDTQTLSVSGGGGPNYLWQLGSGALPPGMTISVTDVDADVTISGTPTASGQYNFSVNVYDWPNYPGANGCTVGDTETYRITVNSGGHVTIVLDTQPNTGVNVLFSADWGNWVLDEDPSGAPPKQRTFLVMPGSYDVIQGDPADWGYELTAINCTTGQIYDLVHHKMTILVQNDVNYTCTFVNVFRRVDLEISKAAGGPFKGNNIYANLPKPTQTQTRSGVPRGIYHDFVRIGNDGPQHDNFRVKAATSGSPKFAVRFFFNGTDVTGAVRQGTWETGDLLHGQSVVLDVRIVEQPGAPSGAASRVVVSAGSVGRRDQVDFVRAITTR